MKYSATVKVPACWRDLIQVVFPEDLAGITSEKHQKGNADPEPHYDDARRVGGRFENGADFSVELCSGQGNYYGGVSIYQGGEEVFNDFLEDFDNFPIRVDIDGATYELHLEWEK